jgi:hypothetical protein
MSSATGIPYDVIAAQANDESAFNATARSSAGALGWLQFLPSTYDSYAAQAGVSPGSEFNPRSEAKVYELFMNDLLKQEKGNLRNALAAYNAGPGNLGAGYAYADKILGEAGQGGGSTIATTGLPIPGLGGSLSISGILSNLFGDMRDILERFGLILLGAALILVGIHILSSGSSTQTIQNIVPSPSGSSKGSSKPGKAAAGGAEKVGASEAIEAAAVA